MATPLSDYFSQKQLISINESIAPINIWEGAVSSGKTYASLWRFHEETDIGPDGPYAIITKTYDTFKRNLMPILEDVLGRHVRYFSGKREVYFKDKLIHVIGCADERAEQKIRGTTFAGAYVDEATLIPESAFKMLQSRLRIPKAKLFCTTNPDSPYHWFRKDYLIDNPDVRSWQFLMDDNPFITKDYKDYLKRQYKGLWHRRYIMGEWVQAEGAVYEFFDEKIHVIDYPRSSATYYIVGVDYGTINPCAFVLIGYNPHRSPNLWVEDEYYYNSRVKQRQKTDGELADDLQKFIEGKRIEAIYIDPSAASFKVELSRRGVDNIFDANNDVNNGIGFVGMKLNEESFKICRKCKNLIQEFQSYVWDEKAAKMGVEKPKKENDHCFEAGTLIATPNGEIPIEELREGELVLTSEGYKPILKTWKHEAESYEYNILGINYKCTDSHKFFTLNRGFVEVSNLLSSDLFIVNIEETCTKQLNGTEQSTNDIQNLKHLLTEITIEGGKKDLAVDISIEKFGNSTMGKFHPDTLFITKTGIPLTTTLAISSLWTDPYILTNIGSLLLQNKEVLLKYLLKRTGTKQKTGIDLQRGINGIKSMAKTLVSFLSWKCNATSATPYIKQESFQDQDFVRINVSRNGEEIVVLMMSKKSVFFALDLLSQTNMQKSNVVPNLVERKTLGKREVYNLTVLDKHEFYANGILVSNCLDALRYALMTHFFGKDDLPCSPQDLDRRWRESRMLGPDLPPQFQNPQGHGYQF